MKRPGIWLIFFLLTVWLTGPTWGDNTGVTPSKFLQLTKLAGQWEGKKPSQNGDETIIVHYDLTAKGTALMETLFPESKKEMISVYVRDGQEIVMTHYCMLGNQPRLRTITQENPNSLTFVYLDGTGMRSFNEMHMHELTITMIDADHMTHQWTFFDKGTEKTTEIFAFTRIKY